MAITLHRSALAECDPVVLYRMLSLRVRIFVVEQAAAYDDLDGRDLEPGAEMLWAEDDGVVVSTLRILRDPGILRIGRVATEPAARGAGVAGQLLRRALERCREIDPEAPILIDAQAHLAGWYARFGFEVSGEQYVEDGIPHLPMRRTPARA